MVFLSTGFFVILIFMAYEVTATRRRPKTFDELVGQDFVVATLKSSIESGKIAQAYLFSGPRGCGKTSAARILARSLNCTAPTSAGPCGSCSNCVEIARGANLDVIEIDGASNTSVNDVRQIKDEVLFPPNSSKYKIYIIDEVHMLSNSAFNALLKTIEEPPPWIIFIFATTELHKVPATIKSRCQQFAFRLISIDIIKDILADTCREMGIEADSESLFWIAREATGSLRDAYTLFDQVLAFSGGKIDAALIREKLGIIGQEAVDQLVSACTRGDREAAFKQLDEVLQQGLSIEQLVGDLSTYYRSLLLIKSGITRDSLIGYSVDRFNPENLESLSVAQIHHALDLLLNLYRNIRFSVSPRYEIEATIAALSWLSSWISMEELSAAVEGVQGLLRGQGEPIIAAPPADISIGEAFNKMIAEKKKPQTLTELPPEKNPEPVQRAEVTRPELSASELKEELEKIFKRNRGFLASALAKSDSWQLDGKNLSIRVGDKLTAELLEKESAIIINESQQLLGRPLGFAINIEKREEKKEEAQGEHAAAVENVIRLFRGTIVN